MYSAAYTALESTALQLPKRGYLHLHIGNQVKTHNNNNHQVPHQRSLLAV
jgi:hypothetical protein